MGLDISCGHSHIASWSYSGFMAFRVKLAKEIGINLREMVGFDGNTPWTSDDPIIPLLNHSDCDGELSPEECKAAGPRLRALVMDWDEDDYDRMQALHLAAGMDASASTGEPLRFH